MEFFITVVFLGIITGAIAHKKGHSFAKWCFYGAALFIVALPMAIMLKPAGEVAGTTAIMGGLRKCPKCAELIQPEAQVCRFCNAEVAPMSVEEQKQIKAAAEKEAKKATYVPGWLVAVVFVGIAIFIYAMAHDSAPNSGGDAGNPINAGLSGVSAASNYLTKPQKNAVRSAKQYINMQGFSRDGLIHQLASNYGGGYTVADATVAVDSLNIDWNMQAVKSAKQYLSMQGFSCKGLIQQLSSSAGNKYTESQATYGAQQAGACE
ncbi:MAG: Ltp family lipoprotein [Desulfurivibrionaceae bacterium]